MLEVFFENFFKKEEQSENKIIKSCPLFSKLTGKELSFLKSILHNRIYADGETIFKPASGDRNVYYIKRTNQYFKRKS